VKGNKNEKNCWFVFTLVDGISFDWMSFYFVPEFDALKIVPIEALEAEYKMFEAESREEEGWD